MWERSHVNNSFRYIFIYHFSYLLTYYYLFLAHYNRKCFDMNWFHLLVPPSCLCGILALRSHDFWEMTNSKTRLAEWKQISKVCHLVIAVFSLWVQSHNFWEIKFGYVLLEVLHGDFFIWNKIFSQPTVKYFTNINQNFFFLLLITPIEMNCHSKFSSFSPNTCFEVKISQSENIAMTRWRDLLIWRHLLW
jgi:hypothetical protein